MSVSIGPGRRRLMGAAVLGAAALALGGCNVGSGSGTVEGTLWVVGCDNGQNFASEADPGTFNLAPTFFAGQPVEDLSQGPVFRNQLFIRMQGNGGQIQYQDVLYFDVDNSYEVARCLRGRTVGGQPDWNVDEPPGSGNLWCDWSGTAFSDGGAADAATDAATDAGATLDGGMSVMAQYPRIHISTTTDLQSALYLNATCPGANVLGDGTDGWIEFMSFGDAEEPNLAPEDRDPVPADFLINYGDRLHATFYDVINDNSVVVAKQMNEPLPTPMIGGTLSGYFDFELARGRAAQPFP